MLAVAAGHHEADQIFAIARGEGDHEKELDVLLAGKGGDDVAGTDGLRVAALGSIVLGDVPGVGAIVKSFGVADVIHAVHFGLGAEHGFGIAGVLAEVGGHGGGRLEEMGKEVAVGAQHRVFFVEDVKMDGAVIGVDGGLDGVANVIHIAGAFDSDAAGIGMAVGGHVAIDHPDEVAFGGDDEIGVAIPEQETGEGVEAVRHFAADHHAAFGREVTGEEDVPFAFGERGGEAQADGGDGETAGARVAGVDGFVGGGVVEFGLGGADEDGLVDGFAVVEFGTGELQAVGGDDGRSVLNKENGGAVGSDAFGFGHDQAIAVGVDETGIDPTRARFAERGDIDLARGEQDLAQLAVEGVAVDVDFGVDVRAEGLELRDGGVEGAPIPEADVVEEGFVGGEVELGFGLDVEGDFFGAVVEAEGGTGGGNVALDVRAFEGDFAGVDVGGGDDGRDDGANEEGGGEDEKPAELSGQNGSGGDEAGADFEP